MKYWNTLVFFFYKTAPKKLLWSWVRRRLLRDTLGFRGMFQLDFCLWVSRFELFMIELHTIFVQGIYEKKTCFFCGGGGSWVCRRLLRDTLGFRGDVSARRTSAEETAGKLGSTCQLVHTATKRPPSKTGWCSSQQLVVVNYELQGSVDVVISCNKITGWGGGRFVLIVLMYFFE